MSLRHVCSLLSIVPIASDPLENASNLRSPKRIHGVDDGVNSSEMLVPPGELRRVFAARNPSNVFQKAIHKGLGAAQWPGKHVRVSGRTIEEDREKAYYDVDEFFQSGEVYDWAAFGAASLIYWAARDGRLKPAWDLGEVGSLLLWVLLGCMFNALMYARWGEDIGVLWLDGYVMELIFSMENAVFFLALAEIFAAPVVAVHRVLVLVVVWQNLYALVLYMGFATTLDKLSVLPYILGAWLLLAGTHSMREGLHTLQTLPSIFSNLSSWIGEEEPLEKGRTPRRFFSVRRTADLAAMESFPVRAFSFICGERFANTYDSQDPRLFVVKDPATQQSHVTMLFLLLVLTILLDSLFEVDVTLTKIEYLQHPFVSFTSSALASFAMPELVFVTWKLTRRCPLVNVGISLILILFGGLMLVKSKYVIGPLEECVIMLSVLFIFVLVSEIGAFCVSA